MVDLLDVNVLISLVDREHAAHSKTRSWFHENSSQGWATCSITELGFCRILLHPSYPNPIEPFILLEKLRENEYWHWWEDTCSPTQYLKHEFVSSKQITDLHLIALAVKHNGRLVTLDKKIQPELIKYAKEQNFYSF